MKIAQVDMRSGHLGRRCCLDLAVWRDVREAFRRDGPALVDVVTDPAALSIPPHITGEQLTGFALSASKMVINGGVGRMLQLARSNLRNIPRP
ncbi:hypothetical protein [Actinoallomurus iriomotensis]|uniref:Uncharacterized protein n=1 Tax=Actinoallomurus iriomotensis TaxID=478107 RepID=A0A9W6VZF3_9ACTN|nr:hypothetical protein Airi02_025810 [Actinoallomurus iriomotensis]